MHRHRHPGTDTYADTDTDGYGDPTSAVVSCSAPTGTTADDTDCDDAVFAVNPGATEVCNSIDDDCDGLIDDDDGSLDTSTTTTWYADDDGDGYGDAADIEVACGAPSGFESSGRSSGPMRTPRRRLSKISVPHIGCLLPWALNGSHRLRAS